MNILLVIDHFGSGGAQRQIVELACHLKTRGHRVEVFVYFPQYDFHRRQLEAHEVKIHEYRSRGGFSFGVIRALVTRLRHGHYDVVVSYLKSTNVYVELAKVFAPRTRLIVSERTNYQDDKSWWGSQLRRVLHVMADHVVANSQSQTAWLQKKTWLTNRTSCIYNGIDLDKFSGSPLIPTAEQEVKLLVVGRVGPEKNVLNLVRALALLEREGAAVPSVYWAGRRDSGPIGKQYCAEVDELLEQLPQVASRWHWLGERDDIPDLLRQHHALVHPSFYEGLPNVVCEALAVGRPVLISNVCDHPLLVEPGVRGFLFDPEQPKEMAVAIRSLYNLNDEQWRRICENCREYAKQNLSLTRMTDAYENLFEKLLATRSQKHV